MRAQTAQRRRDKAASAKKSAPIKNDSPVTSNEYLRTPEAARYVKLSDEYLEAARYRGDGSGPPFVKLERAVIYRKRDLDAWMESKLHAADKPI